MYLGSNNFLSSLYLLIQISNSDGAAPLLMQNSESVNSVNFEHLDW
jgi:hypothetical protein